MAVQLKHHTGRLSRESWLLRALDVLKREGIAGVRVERLARELGVTKGSFYHHFGDRPELMGEMLRYWAEELTRRAIEIIDDAGGDASNKLLALMRLITDEDMGRFETSIRAWASFDPIAAQEVTQVDHMRFKFINSLFAASGFEGLEGEMRTRTFMYYMIAEPSIFYREAKSKQRQLQKLRHSLLTKPIEAALKNCAGSAPEGDQLGNESANGHEN